MVVEKEMKEDIQEAEEQDMEEEKDLDRDMVAEVVQV